MLELKQLIKQLRSYPENSFAYSAEGYNLGPEAGLMIVDLDGYEQGFIELGGKEGVLVK